MQRLARLVVFLGTMGTIGGLSKVHAVRHSYDYTNSFRFVSSIIFLILLLVAAYALGLPDLARTRRSAIATSVGAVASGAGTLSLMQLVTGSAALPRFVVFGSALLLVPIYTLAGRMSADAQRQAEGRDRIVLVGDAAAATALHDELERAPERPARLVASIDPRDVAPRSSGPVGAVVDIVARERATVIVLDRVAQADDAIVGQAAQLHLQGVRVRTLQLFYEEWLGKLPVGELERVSLMFDIGELHRARYSRAKRVVDVAAGLAGMPFFLLTVFVVAIGNCFGNRGPMFFAQTRVGRRGRLFSIYKFRTMRPSASSVGEWTGEKDPRITPFGRFLRVSHLDELPQVWNIVRGDLSIVGPRPEQPHYVEELREKLPFYDYRHIVRPGLTGWAQVKYPYGANEADALEKLQYEFFYLRRQSLGLDLRVLGRTIRAVAGRGGR